MTACSHGSMSAPRICTTPWSSRDRRPQTPSAPLTGSRRHRGRTQDAKGVEVEEPVGKPEIPETDDPEAVPVESDAETQASNLW